MNEYITRADLAVRWNRSTRTLANMVSLNRGPSVARRYADGSIAYLLIDVVEYERANDMSANVRGK